MDAHVLRTEYNAQAYSVLRASRMGWDSETSSGLVEVDLSLNTPSANTAALLLVSEEKGIGGYPGKHANAEAYSAILFWC